MTKKHFGKGRNIGLRDNGPVLPSGPCTMLRIYKATVGVYAKALAFN